MSLVLVGLLLLPINGWAAIAFVSSTQTANVAPASNFTFSHNNTGDFLAVCVAFRDGGENRTITSVTYNSVGLTQAVMRSRQFGDTSFGKTYLYILDAPATGSNTVAVTFSGSVGAVAAAVAQSYSGVSNSASLGAVNSTDNSGSTQNPTLSITTTAANSWLIDCVYDKDNVALTGAGAGQTIVMNQNLGAVLDTTASSYASTTSTGVYTMSWTASLAEEWISTVMEITPDTGGGGGGGGSTPTRGLLHMGQ